MAMVPIQGGLWIAHASGFTQPLPTITTNSTTALMSASTNRLAFVLRVPKTGILDGFEWRTGAVTNDPDNGLKFSFQDVSANVPDGVVDQFRDFNPSPFVAGTWYNPGLITDDGTDTGVKRSVTKGDILACVIEFVSFVADSIHGSILTYNGNFGPVFAVQPYNYSLRHTTAWGSPDYNNYQMIVLKYNDGTYPMLDDFRHLPLSGINTQVFQINSTPDEIGLRFQVPYDCKLDMIEIRGGTFGNPFDIVIYDAADTVLATITGGVSKTTSGGPYIFPLDTSLTLTANTVYRITIKPTSGSSISIYEYVVPSAYLSAYPLSQEFYGTSRVDAGAWTDDTTVKPAINLRLSEIDVTPSSGGGGESSSVFG